MTRVLSLCGLELPRTLVDQNEHNEDGYWESLPLNLLNGELLRDMDSSWDDVLASRPNRVGRYGQAAVERLRTVLEQECAPNRDVVIKDPRISVMLGLWRDAIESMGLAPRLVIMVRDPLEVAASLGRRDAFPTTKSVLLWLAHLIAVERDSRGLPRVFVSYEDLLKDWRNVLKRVEGALDLRLPRWHSTAEAEIDRFLSPDRRNHAFDHTALRARADLPGWIAPAYEWALAATKAETGIDPAPLDAIAASYHAAAEIFAPLLSAQQRVLVEKPTEAKPHRPIRETVVRVYCATAQETYDEASSVAASVQLTPSPQTVTIATPVRDSPITGLRLDPSEREGRVLLHGLRVRSPDRQMLWEWHADTSLFSPAKGISAELLEGGEALLELLNDDPQAELPVTNRLGGAQQVTIDLTLSAPTDADLAYMRVGAALLRSIESVGPEVARAAEFAQQAKTLAANAIVAADERASQLGAFMEQRLAAFKEEVAAQSRAMSRAYESNLEDVRRQLQATEQSVRDSVERLEGERAARDAAAQYAADLAQERDRARAEAEAARREAERVAETAKSEIDALRRDADASRRVAEEKARENQAILASTSWSVTAPFRIVRRGPVGVARALWSAARQLRAGIRKVLTGKSYAADPTRMSRELGEQADMLLRSSYFDPAWYLAANADLREARVDPVTHYLMHGAFEGRAAGPAFDSRWYMAQNPDVAAAGVNPLIHFIVAGKREGRAPMPPRRDGPPPKRWKYAAGQTALKLDALLPRGTARWLRARVQANSPLVADAGAAVADTSAHAATMGSLYAAASSRGDDYVPLTAAPIDMASRIRAIAYYLPQFHPIPENDAWWGKGFTEWTNVSKAVPQFVGHYQPRLPDELGYYDLRISDVQRRQVELAKHYGVHGFCFHYYWFTGRRRLLERPLNQFLAADMDFPFCICWANENWTRRWDGMDSEILMEQRHAPEDDLQFIEDLAPVLNDARYIRVDGKPLVVVYRVDILPHPQRTAQVWRDYCRVSGIGEILLVAAQTFGTTDPRKFGFDAAVEFPPHKINTAEVTRDQHLLNGAYLGKVFSYPGVAKAESRVEWPEYKLFKTVMPAWDNEARKPGKGHAFAGSTPAIYKGWFDAVCRATDEHARTADEKIVFINAWNEWAEGAYLEPDRRFGYGYLQATRDTLTAFPTGASPAVPAPASEAERSAAKSAHNAPPPLHVVVHAFYPDVFEEMAICLRQAPVPFRLTVTCPPERASDVQAAFERSNLDCPFEIIVVPNRGRDVLAFFEALRQADIAQDAVILKIHTKATNHRIDGDDWRREIIDRLMAPHVITRVLEAFAEDDSLGLVAPGRHIAPLCTYIGENQPHIDALLRRGGWKPISSDDVFAAGTMFFMRRRNLQSLIDLNLQASVYGEEAGQKDGTVAHAMERLFAMVVLREGGKISDTEAVLNGWEWSANSDFAYAVKTDYLFKPT